MTAQLYETDQLLAEYLLFHYGEPSEILPADPPEAFTAALHFPLRTVRHFSDIPRARALDLGCAVGRAACELSRTCDQVLGIDLSHNFIRAARAILTAPFSYQRRDEGHLSSPLQARLPPGVKASRIQYQQADALHLPDDLGAFDRVHAANLLCRLPDPARLLDRLPDLVACGGELILTTPCTWIGEFTPPENWPEGGTLDWLRAHLDPHFELAQVADEPFLIRETCRKYQYTTAQLSYWKRVG